MGSWHDSRKGAKHVLSEVEGDAKGNDPGNDPNFVCFVLFVVTLRQGSGRTDRIMLRTASRSMTTTDPPQDFGRTRLRHRASDASVLRWNCFVGGTKVSKEDSTTRAKKDEKKLCELGVLARWKKWIV
ncbi:MAG TPA: hypothetical protein VGR30_10965 [Candidatus Binatia bacterium]|nr:hypothetical protein [Candidatus Binatia bacterium]